MGQEERRPHKTIPGTAISIGSLADLVNAAKVEGPPPKPDELAVKEQNTYAGVHDKLDEHTKSIKTLNAWVIGVGVVVGIGFIALIVTAIIQFSQTTVQFQAQIKALTDENAALKAKIVQTQIDSLSAQVGRMSRTPAIKNSPNP